MPIKKRISTLLGLDKKTPQTAQVQKSNKPTRGATTARPARSDATNQPPAQKPAIGQLKPLRSMAPRTVGLSSPPDDQLPAVGLERTIIKTNEDANLERPHTLVNASTAVISQESALNDQFTKSHWQQTPLHRNHQQQLCLLDNVPSTNITHEFAGEPELSTTTHDPVVTETVHQSHKHQLHRKITHEKHLFQHEKLVQPIVHNVTAEQVLHSQQLPELRHQSTKMQISAVHEEDLKRKIERHIQNVPAKKADTHVYEECPPHLHEIVHRHIIREIHPVIRREVHVPHLHQDYQHLHEIHYDPIMYKDLEILETLSYNAWQAQMQKSGVRTEMNKPAFTDF